MEYEPGYLTKEAAERKLYYNNYLFGVQAFKYCANVCNLWKNASNTNINTSESQCLQNCANQMSEIRENFITAFNEKLEESGIPDIEIEIVDEYE